MKKLLFILLISTYSLLYSQDVVIYVQAKHEITPVELDTIIIENMNNGSIANLYNLPLGHTNYEINLSQGAEVNSIFKNTVNNPSFRVIANEIGFCSFNITSNNPNSIKVELFDIKGQLLYSANKTLNSGANAFEFQHGYSGLCILKLTTRDGVYSIKAIGDGNSGTSLVNSGVQEREILSTSKSVKSEFTYNIGDTIKITAKKINYHSNTIVIKPENDENYNIYISCPCSGIPTVTDYDGNIYNTVQIGNQCWMKENMNTTHYADGNAIQFANSNTNWDWPDVRYYFNCNDNPENSNFSGKLYTSGAALRGVFGYDEDLTLENKRGPCPVGWHIPNNSEWSNLMNYTGSESNATFIKATYGWANENNGIDKYGFSALPSGAAKALTDGTGYYFENCDSVAKFWTSSIDIYAVVYYWYLSADSEEFQNSKCNTLHGYSIRCLKDE